MKIPALFTNPMYLIDPEGSIPDYARFFKVPTKLVPLIYAILPTQRPIGYNSDVSFGTTCIIYDDTHIALQLTGIVKDPSGGWNGFTPPMNHPFYQPQWGQPEYNSGPANVGYDDILHVKTIHQYQINGADEVCTYVDDKRIIEQPRSGNPSLQQTFPQIINTVTRFTNEAVVISRQHDTAMQGLLMINNYRTPEAAGKLLDAGCVEVKPTDDDFGWLVKPESIVYIKPVTE